MENRVHSMVLVHESLYRSENLARVNFAEYAQTLATDIMSSHGSLSASIRLKSELEPIVMNVDLAIPCGLILNELISNALKHGFSNGTGGEIKMTLRHGPKDTCILDIEDNGVGIPADLDPTGRQSLGLKLVRSLTKQIRGAFELVNIDMGTSAQLRFKVDRYVL
jgi:two-component sensor histidine kinase